MGSSDSVSSVDAAGDDDLDSIAMGSSDSFDSAEGFGGMVALVVVATVALGAATGFACVAVGDIAGVGFAIAGVGVCADNGVAGFSVSALTSVCSSSALVTGSKSCGFKNGFDVED